MCPRNALGQPECLIVEHPDRFGESFCATCGKRFHSENWMLSSIISLVVFIALLVLILNAQSESNSDSSTSMHHNFSSVSPEENVINFEFPANWYSSLKDG
jgi:hypothetical protein